MYNYGTAKDKYTAVKTKEKLHFQSKNNSESKRKELEKMKTIKTFEEAKGKLRYELFAEETDNMPHYGISVTSDIFGEPETAAVSDITTETEFAERMFRMIADNFVLPSTFSEVVEELITAEFTV